MDSSVSSLSQASSAETQASPVISRRENINNNESFASRASFAGRRVAEQAFAFWEGAHRCTHQSVGLVGAALGAVIGGIGGAVYKVGKSVIGQGAQTKSLSDYAIRSARVGYNMLSTVSRVITAPAVAAAALAFSAVGVAGAVVGATVATVAAPVYKMVKHALGQGAQTKRISDYIISSAAVGSKVAMSVAALGLVGAGCYFCPLITMRYLAGVACVLSANAYIESRPGWLTPRYE